MYPPTNMVTINSPWQLALLPMQRLNAIWNRHYVRDWKFTYPLQLFVSEKARSGELIPNRNTLLEPAIAESNIKLMGRPVSLDAYEEANSEIKTDGYYKEISRRADKHRENALEEYDPKSKVGEHSGLAPSWHPQLDFPSTESYIDQLRPFELLPQTVSSDSAAARPTESTNFQQAIDRELFQITMALGCPPSLFSRETVSRFSTEDIYDELVDNRIDSYQRSMEKLLAQLYIFLYSEQQIQRIRDFCGYEAVREKQRKELKRMETHLKLVETRLAELSGDPSSAKLIQVKSLLERKATELNRRITLLTSSPDALDYDSPDESMYMEEIADEDLDDDYEERTEKQLRDELRVEVEFFPNRTITLDKVDALRNMKAITWDSARQLALSICNQAPTKLATVEELLAEQKILEKLGLAETKEEKKPEPSPKRQKIEKE